MSNNYQTIVCPFCNDRFEDIELVNTWTGTAWYRTCGPCNRKAFPQHELVVADIWWRATWAEQIAWQEAIIAAQQFGSIKATRTDAKKLEYAAASGKWNVMVTYLARLLRRSEAEVQRELYDRAMVAAPGSSKTGGSGSSAGRASGTMGTAGALLPTPIPSNGKKTSVKWPVRSGA